MMHIVRAVAMAALVAGPGAPALAQDAANWTVRSEWVRAHEAFLASDALEGRGSATRDEAIAAAYVASQFEGYGLRPAPGMHGYLQSAWVIRPRLSAPPVLSVDGAAVRGLTLLVASDQPIRGTLALWSGSGALPAGDVVLVTSHASMGAAVRAAAAAHVKLLIVQETDETRARYAAIGGAPRLSAHLADTPAPTRMGIATLPADALAAIAGHAGAEVTLTLPELVEETLTTTNAIGFLPGTDPKAGVLLLTAHLDHLGKRADGVIMHGANDDAAGTTAVLELAHALAAGKPMRRGVLFVCYGSEEAGEFGSEYFGAHPPVPLANMVANIEFEMIGAQDPKQPPGVFLLTGYERSNLGEALRAHGALIGPDPYPEENLFMRSDNYQLALQGVVAHTIGGSPLNPTYHQPSDTIANLDFGVMTRAIQSFIGPMRWLADSGFTPAWKPEGRPTR